MKRMQFMFSQCFSVTLLKSLFWNQLKLQQFTRWNDHIIIMTQHTIWLQNVPGLQECRACSTERMLYEQVGVRANRLGVCKHGR